MALALSFVFGSMVFNLFIALAALLSLKGELRMFKDDVVAALGTQSTAIDNLAARLPAPVDPATVVPLTDQADVVSGIAANTAKIDALAPKT
jgi:hypothetical protein